jgi:hypothetical protein
MAESAVGVSDLNSTYLGVFTGSIRHLSSRGEGHYPSLGRQIDLIDFDDIVRLSA